MFSNYNYDIVIVGGGISGLFLAYKLLSTNLKVILFEGDKRLGGRIKTIEKNGSYFESGAARIHNSHGKLISLIHDLGLRDDLMRLPDDIDLILRNKKEKFPYQTKWVDIDPMLLLKSSLESKDLFEEKELQRITFFQYLTLILDHEAAIYIKDAFGYDSEIVDLNAYAAINMFEKDLFNNESHYYILKNGMSQLIDKIEKMLMLSSTILKTSTGIVEINDNNVITTKKEIFYFNHLICAIPQSSLNRFPIFLKNPLTQSVKQCPLLRIYAKYPKNNVWFKNIKRTITDNYIRHIIPIDPESGLIMISYTDGKLTEYWNSYHTLGEEYLIKALHKEIKDLFGISPPKPEFISVHYWNDGLHTWKLGIDNQDVYKKMLKPFKDKEIYVSGEAFSLKQGWIEGALETCYELLNIIPSLDLYKKVKYEFECNDIDDRLEYQVIKEQKEKIKTKNIKKAKESIKKPEPKKVVEKKSEPNKVVEKKPEPKPVVEKKQEPKKLEEPESKKVEKPEPKKVEKPEPKKVEKPEPKKVEKPEPKDTVLSLNKVLEEDEWIILEVNGKKNVYDISNWISKHPGGASILKGVEANKHYQNPKVYPESPTDIFKGNHVHDEADAWEKYVAKNNNDVKLVGYIN
jgi:protoporphyrinogen oxidase